MGGIPNEYRLVVEPLIDDLVGKPEGPAAKNLDAVSRVRHGAREPAAAVISLARYHGRQMVPEELLGVHRVVPIVLA